MKGSCMVSGVDCPDRHAGCQADCEKYKAYRKQRAEELKHRKKLKIANNLIDEYNIKNAIRYNKRRGK